MTRTLVAGRWCLVVVLAAGACSRAGFGGPDALDDGGSGGGLGAACLGVTCSGHGECGVAPDGRARCLCDPGYRADGLACVVVGTDPCASVDCGPGGRCGRTASGLALCVCDPGSASGDGGACSPVVTACLGVDCGAHGTCVRFSDGGHGCACTIRSTLVSGVCAPLDAGAGG